MAYMSGIERISFEKSFEIAFAIGFEKGMQLGIKQTASRIAANMLKEGFNEQIIINLTELNETELARLKNSILVTE